MTLPQFNTSPPSNAYFQGMRTDVVFWVATLLFASSCSNVYVGPRMGFDVPLSSPSDALITDESSPSTGVAGGVVLGIHATDRLTIEAAPGVLSMEQRIVRRGSYVDNSVGVDLTAFSTMSASLAELPIHVRYAFASRETPFVPFVFAGASYQYVRARSYTLNGTSRIADVEWPFFDENQSALGASGRSSIAVLFGGGFQYALSTTWHVRGDVALSARTSALSAGVGNVLIGYDAFDTAMYYDFTSAFSRTSLTFHVGIVGYF